MRLGQEKADLSQTKCKSVLHCVIHLYLHHHEEHVNNGDDCTDLNVTQSEFLGITLGSKFSLSLSLILCPLSH